MEDDEEIIQEPTDHEDWDVEPNDMWEEEESGDIEDLQEDVEEQITPQSDDYHGNTSNWTMDDGTALSMEAGTEPPQRDSTRGVF